MKALSIKVGSDKVEEVDVDVNKYEVLRDAVGGPIEMVRIHDRAVAWINELGKFECERNELATRLFANVLFAGDFISGDVLITGVDWASGDNCALPEGLDLEKI